MKNSDDTIITLSDWFSTPMGQYVAQWEMDCLAALTVDIFGFHAVQIGGSALPALQANRMPNRWNADMMRPSSGTDNYIQIEDFADLPFSSQSVDLVVLPHVLEFAKEPHQVLREVERILLPEGHIIICGFNPVSLFGLRQSLSRLTKHDYLPSHGEFLAPYRMRDWLKLLSMEVDRGHFGCYAPAFTTQKWLNRFHFMETIGSRWWPFCSGVYIVHAIKRVHGMRLIGPVWDKKKAKLPKGVPATNKVRQSRQ